LPQCSFLTLRNDNIFIYFLISPYFSRPAMTTFYFGNLGKT